jgi:hypothetical protein
VRRLPMNCSAITERLIIYIQGVFKIHDTTLVACSMRRNNEKGSLNMGPLTLYFVVVFLFSNGKYKK